MLKSSPPLSLMKSKLPLFSTDWRCDYSGNASLWQPQRNWNDWQNNSLTPSHPAAPGTGTYQTDAAHLTRQNVHRSDQSQTAEEGLCFTFKAKVVILTFNLDWKWNQKYEIFSQSGKVWILKRPSSLIPPMRWPEVRRETEGRGSSEGSLRDCFQSF